MRMSGMKALSGVRWLVAMLAALVVLAVAVPGAWAGEVSVDLKEDEKHFINESDETADAKYNFEKAEVTGDDSTYIVVQVDSGYFSPQPDLSGATIQRALNDNDTDVTGSYADPIEKYTYVAFKSSDGAASVTADAVQDYLRHLDFTLDGDTAQKVTVTVVPDPMPDYDYSTDMGLTVSATTRCVNVSYDLDEEVTSTSVAGRLLTNTGDYSTTL